MSVATWVGSSATSAARRSGASDAQLPGKVSSRGAIIVTIDVGPGSPVSLAGLAYRTQAEHAAHCDREQAQQGRQQGAG